MPVTITLDAALGRRGMTGKQLAQMIGISETQLSLFRSGKVRGIRFSTLAKMCAVLGCVPGELLGYEYKVSDLAPAEEAEE
jgi:putative transcriptional regulator